MAAIERAQNELVRFVERELARQDVSIHSLACFIISFFFDVNDVVLERIDDDKGFNTGNALRC